MYHLATLIPGMRRLRLPLTRDQLMMLMASIMLIFLGIDIFLAHSISGTIVPNEWIPIYFGPIAGVILLLAGLVAQRNRPLATITDNIILLASIVVGLLGAYFHVVRAILPSGPIGQQASLSFFIWAPPVLGPLTFSLVGVIGISAAWIESPADSGTLIFLGGRRLRLPYSKTQAYFFMVSMGTLATLLSSVLDHARTPFENPWLWLPTAVGVLGVVIPAALGAIDHPTRADIATYTVAMVLLILVGVIGLILHINENLVAEGTIVIERFLRGSPFLAPMLFSNMGALGLIALLDPEE